MKRFTLMFMALIMSVLVFAQESQSVTYDFDDGTLQGWTTIDADGDGYVWENTTQNTGQFDAQAGSTGAVCSASYINKVGALNPDNYLVSPKVTLGETFSFYAVAQDASYAAEHFAVCVSTAGNTDPADFKVLQEWTLTKARGNNAVRAKVTRIPVKAPRNAPLKVQGKWYQYIVDLSDYAGKEGYVAIRHFNCTDKFYMLVDNITFGTPVEIVDEGPTLVELPEDAEVNPYVMVYTDASNNTASTPVNVAVVGTDVYFQGMSYLLPEAWVKGAMADNVVTFPAKQYVGVYSSYEYPCYAFYSGDATFTYDAEANTYTAEGEIYGVEVADAYYYDGHYFDPVLSAVVEKAAMPANPEITKLQSSDWGYVMDFNIPLIDTDGAGLVADKLSYMIYSDTEGEIAPLTFTPATHSLLTEDMTEIPYGFTENYDFYKGRIYLNDLYDSKWN
ncbi:MAG: choice-of-anchor J domain-containing protein, partial [Prevotella sp.]|nr:choice-of-anchor J domain-containing protein [Prevotella sp.]